MRDRLKTIGATVGAIAVTVAIAYIALKASESYGEDFDSPEWREWYDDGKGKSMPWEDL